VGRLLPENTHTRPNWQNNPYLGSIILGVDKLLITMTPLTTPAGVKLQVSSKITVNLLGSHNFFR
jgi:hypothetical protein